MKRGDKTRGDEKWGINEKIQRVGAKGDVSNI
jgi:hypothetical protein